MALTGAQASALLVLLEAPSKQAVDAFFCSCFRERQRHAAGPIDDARHEGRRPQQAGSWEGVVKQLHIY